MRIVISGNHFITRGLSFVAVFIHAEPFHEPSVFVSLFKLRVIIVQIRSVNSAGLGNCVTFK